MFEVLKRLFCRVVMTILESNLDPFQSITILQWRGFRLVEEVTRTKFEALSTYHSP